MHSTDFSMSLCDEWSLAAAVALRCGADLYQLVLRGRAEDNTASGLVAGGQASYGHRVQPIGADTLTASRT